MDETIPLAKESFAFDHNTLAVARVTKHIQNLLAEARSTKVAQDKAITRDLAKKMMAKNKATIKKTDFPKHNSKVIIDKFWSGDSRPPIVKKLWGNDNTPPTIKKLWGIQ